MLDEFQGVAHDYDWSVLVYLGFERCDFVEWDDTAIEVGFASLVLPVFSSAHLFQDADLLAALSTSIVRGFTVLLDLE